MERNRLGGLLAAGLLCAAGASRAEAPRQDWRFSSSLNYESGAYGTGTRSSFLYVPFTAKRTFGDAFASLTVPILSQTTDGGVSNIGGRPVKTGRGRGAGSARTTRSGLGDLVLRGGWDVMREDPELFDLTAVVKLKVPTADRNKGLGTGEFDAGAGLEAARTVAPGWTLLADLSYTAIGDPPGVNLNNQVAVDAGVAHLIEPNLTGTVLFEASNAVYPGTPAPVAMRGLLDYRLNEQASVNGGLLAGLSSGSADYGVSFGGTIRF